MRIIQCGGFLPPIYRTILKQSEANMANPAVPFQFRAPTAIQQNGWGVLLRPWRAIDFAFRVPLTNTVLEGHWSTKSAWFVNRPTGGDDDDDELWNVDIQLGHLRLQATCASEQGIQEKFWLIGR